MAGFNYICYCPEFDDKLDREMDFTFNMNMMKTTKKSLYEPIYEGFNKMEQVARGTRDADDVSSDQIPAGIQPGHAAPLPNFGNCNFQHYLFAPQVHLDTAQDGALNYRERALTTYEERSAHRGSRWMSGIARTLSSIPGQVVRSVLGKRPASCPVSENHENDHDSAGPFRKRSRNNDDGSLGLGAATRGSATMYHTDDNVTCGDRAVLIGGPAGVVHTIPTSTNTNTSPHWKRPGRKERPALFGYLQPVEDRSWDVDPHTGARIQTSLN